MGSLLQKIKSSNLNNDQNIEDKEEFLEIFVQDAFIGQYIAEDLTPRRRSIHSKEALSVADKLSNADPNLNILLSKWNREQIELKNHSLYSEPPFYLDTLKYIGGIDLSFPSNKEDLVHACACLVVVTYPGLEIVYKKLKMVHLTSVYIPEYLAFREVDHLKELCEELKEKQPDIYPQLILVDGNGLLHPRKFGIACHLGVTLDVATIGVAKKLFLVDGLRKDEEFRNKIKCLQSKGSCFELKGISGETYGKALKSTLKSTNPIYVSIGHKICLETAVKIVTACCLVRIPEPIRHADILSREFMRKNYIDHYDSCHLFKDINSYFLRLSKLY